MKNLTANIKTSLIGTAVGFINGIFGAGGGSLLVPILESSGLETKKSHGTTVAVMLPLSAVSAIVYTWGVDIEWAKVVLVSAGGVVGGLIGARLLARLAGFWLNILFGLFLTAGAIRMLTL